MLVNAILDSLNLYFKQLLGTKGCHCAKFCQNQTNSFGDHDFSIIKMATICHLGFSNFWSPIRFGGPIYTVIQNYVKNSQMAAEIAHFTFFK